MRVKEPVYNYAQLKELPIVVVAEKFGIAVNKRYGSAWCNIRNERTPSCKLYETTNTWCDFGDGNRGGDTIAFVAAIQGVSNQVAAGILATTFGISPIDMETKRGAKTEVYLTYRQWEKIGIAGELATMNFNFDIDKYGVERTQAFSEKYRMTVNQLKEHHPKVYENMLRFRAIPYVYDRKQDYYRTLWASDLLHKSLGMDLAAKQNFVGEFGLMAAGMNDMEDIVKLAVKGTTIRYKPTEYDVGLDIQKIRSGEISFEIGTVRYFDLKGISKTSGTPLVYREVSVNQYTENQLKLNALEHAAFVKGDRVNIAVKANDGEALKNTFPNEQQTRNKTV